MQENVTVEETQEQNSTEPVPTVEQEVDPQEALKEALERQSQVEKLEAQIAEQRSSVQAELDSLHHRLATNLVDTLMVSLAEFASEFTEGSLFQKYEGIQERIAKIKEHDEAFPKSLAGGKYSIDMEREEYLFWLNCLEKWICTESLERFLRGVFTGRTVGSPFSNEG